MSNLSSDVGICHADQSRGMDKVEWDSDNVKKMFLATPVNFDDEPSSSDKPSPGGNGSSSDNTGENKGESKSNTGAIAGGIVGGCVVVLGVIGGWLFWRRRNKKKDSTEVSPSVEDPVQGQEPWSLQGPYQQPYEQKKELPLQSTAAEVYVPPVELPSNAHNRWELHSDVRPNELQGDTPPRQELPGPGEGRQ